MTLEQRFIFIMGEIMRAGDISNDDPMRYSKRRAIESARKAISLGLDQAGDMLSLASAIDHDAKEAV